jgi:hypothetical protein
MLRTSLRGAPTFLQLCSTGAQLRLRKYSSGHPCSTPLLVPPLLSFQSERTRPLTMRRHSATVSGEPGGLRGCRCVYWTRPKCAQHQTYLWPSPRPPSAQSLATPSRRLELFRPGQEPPPFVGVKPPQRRWATGIHEDLPENFAWLSSELLRLGDVPVSAITHRVIVLRNLRGASTSLARPDDEEGGESGVSSGPLSFAWDPVHPLVAAGVVRLHPMTGTVPAGGAVVVRVSFAAPAAAQVSLLGYVRCGASVSGLLEGHGGGS